jgi:hypothetical protein
VTGLSGASALSGENCLGYAYVSASGHIGPVAVLQRYMGPAFATALDLAAEVKPRTCRHFCPVTMLRFIAIAGGMDYLPDGTDVGGGIWRLATLSAAQSRFHVIGNETNDLNGGQVMTRTTRRELMALMMGAAAGVALETGLRKPHRSAAAFCASRRPPIPPASIPRPAARARPCLPVHDNDTLTEWEFETLKPKPAWPKAGSSRIPRRSS